MITVGLVNELRFISSVLKTGVHVKLSLDQIKDEVSIDIKDQFLTVSYVGHIIWKESLEDATTMFGIESCDTLVRIICLIDSGDTEQWAKLVYKE